MFLFQLYVDKVNVLSDFLNACVEKYTNHHYVMALRQFFMYFGSLLTVHFISIPLDFWFISVPLYTVAFVLIFIERKNILVKVGLILLVAGLISGSEFNFFVIPFISFVLTVIGWFEYQKIKRLNS